MPPPRVDVADRATGLRATTGLDEETFLDVEADDLESTLLSDVVDPGGAASGRRRGRVGDQVLGPQTLFRGGADATAAMVEERRDADLRASPRGRLREPPSFHTTMPANVPSPRATTAAHVVVAEDASRAPIAAFDRADRGTPAAGRAG